MSMAGESTALWEPGGAEDLGNTRREVRPGDVIQACLLPISDRTASAELISEKGQQDKTDREKGAKAEMVRGNTRR
jgi:hypothetical protein